MSIATLLIMVQLLIIVLAVATTCGQVRIHRLCDAAMKASIAAVSRALLNPGRVGLIAVDALVLGWPMLTTQWPFHAPDFEYLAEGRSVLTSPDDPASWAGRVLDLAGAPDPGASAFQFPQLADMIRRFDSGAASLVGR